MAHIDTHSASGAFSGHGSLLGRIRRFFANLNEAWQLARAERDLNALDDRMLNDIGIRRSEIHDRVWGGRK